MKLFLDSVNEGTIKVLKQLLRIMLFIDCKELSDRDLRNEKHKLGEIN